MDGAVKFRFQAVYTSHPPVDGLCTQVVVGPLCSVAEGPTSNMSRIIQHRGLQVSDVCVVILDPMSGHYDCCQLCMECVLVQGEMFRCFMIMISD